MILQKSQLVVRKIEVEDADKLVQWLSDERVLFFYGGRDQPQDLKMVKDHYLSKPDETVTRCMIEWDQVLIGYIKYYPLEEDKRRAYGYPQQVAAWGMDQFIGEPAYWNRGIGTKLVQGMVEHLVKEKEAEVIVVDPQIRNTRAIRCYEKCGFVRVRMLPRHKLHEGVWQNCWLMAYSDHT